MGCDCFNEKLCVGENYMKNTVLSSVKYSDLKIFWEHKMFWMDGVNRAPVVLRINCEYYKLKKNKDKHKNKSTSYIDVVMTYCPFCGKKYEE